jgi:hypothetical protein
VCAFSQHLLPTFTRCTFLSRRASSTQVVRTSGVFVIRSELAEYRREGESCRTARMRSLVQSNSSSQQSETPEGIRTTFNARRSHPLQHSHTLSRAEALGRWHCAAHWVAVQYPIALPAAKGLVRRHLFHRWLCSSNSTYETYPVPLLAMDSP